ncbi:MAG: glycosyltransferase, partial [Bacteroidota bacterium]
MPQPSQTTAEPDGPPSASGMRSWLSKGSWTVLDQALFAGANFLINVLLARTLSPEAYGAFAVAFVVFLLVGTIHGGLFIEPMLVYGSGRFEGRTAAYLRTLLRGHVAFAMLSGALLATIGVLAWALGEPSVLSEFLVLGVASGFILALWLLRRACYVVDSPQWAAGAGTLYVVLLLAGVWALSSLDYLTGAAALVLMAVGSVAASVVLARRLGVFAARPDRQLAADARRVHADYGRWAAPTGVLEWIHGSLPLLVLPLFVGLEGSGTLRALYNLAMPALQGFAALAVLAVPIFVRARSEGRGRAVARSWGGGIIGLGLLYGSLTLAVGPWVVDVLYDGKYPLGVAELVCLSVLPVVAALSGVLMAWLRSGERPRAVFVARAWAVGVTTTVGVGLTAAFAVVGALLADVLSLAVEAVAQAVAIRRGPRADTPEPGASGDGVGRTRLRVFMNAYACRPGAGSEPAVGWHMVTAMARHHDVWAVTYEGNRASIEAELAERPVPGLTVVYASLPFERQRHLHGEARHGIPEQVHYIAWQWAAARVARRLHAEVGFDLAHHVTFVKYWTPSAARSLGVPYVWGPVGGGEATPDAFVPALSDAGARYERQRALAQRVSEWLPGVRSTARKAARSFATTDATAARLKLLGADPVEVRSAIGLSRDELDQLASVPDVSDGPARFVTIGRHLAWKGFAFAIEAFARVADDPDLDSAELWMIGDGPERDHLEALASSLGVADRVRFTGRIPRDEVLDRLGHTRALVHPSLHDSGGGVCLEAMAAGRPVIGLDLGGTTVHVGDTGVLVPAHTPGQATTDLA